MLELLVLPALPLVLRVLAPRGSGRARRASGRMNIGPEDEARLIGIVRAYCTCRKPTSDEERARFGFPCRAHELLNDVVAARLVELRARADPLERL